MYALLAIAIALFAMAAVPLVVAHRDPGRVRVDHDRWSGTFAHPWRRPALGALRAGIVAALASSIAGLMIVLVCLFLIVLLFGEVPNDPLLTILAYAGVLWPFVAFAANLALAAAIRRLTVRLTASPDGLALDAPWPLRSGRWAWDAVTEVRSEGDRLLVDGPDLVVDPLGEGPEAEQQAEDAAAALEATRLTAVPRAETTRPPELERLRQAATVAALRADGR